MSYPFSSSFPVGLQILSAKVRGFQAAGTTIASHINKAKPERKSKLWDRKRALGTHCRYHLVAYGLLRKIPYEKIERCAQQNRLDPQRVLDIMLAHGDWQQKRDLDLEKVKTLLTATVAGVVESEPAAAKQNALPVSVLTKPASSRPIVKRLLTTASSLFKKGV